MRREVCIAAAGARTELEFYTRLAQAGVLVHRRFSTIHSGEVTGYAVGLAEHTSKTGQTMRNGSRFVVRFSALTSNSPRLAAFAKRRTVWMSRFSSRLIAARDRPAASRSCTSA